MERRSGRYFMAGNCRSPVSFLRNLIRAVIINGWRARAIDRLTQSRTRYSRTLESGSHCEPPFVGREAMTDGRVLDTRVAWLRVSPWPCVKYNCTRATWLLWYVSDPQVLVRSATDAGSGMAAGL